jgi:hypothetical protein
MKVGARCWAAGLALAAMAALALGLSGCCECGSCEEVWADTSFGPSKGGCVGVVDGKEVDWGILPDDASFWFKQDTVHLELVYGDKRELVIRANLASAPTEETVGPHKLPKARKPGAQEGASPKEGTTYVLWWEVEGLEKIIVGVELVLAAGYDRISGSLAFKLKGKGELKCTFNLGKNFWEDDASGPVSSGGGGDWD